MLPWLSMAALAQDSVPDDAQAPSELPLDEVEEITVEAERKSETATERSLDRAAIEAFPARSADELLRAMPGLQLSAHGGNGKALQFLVRGFDAEHGSDLAVTVEGVPVNEPSNVHGQGYIDLHFLPTALVQNLDLVKGSYRAQDGDFAITGAADYQVGLAQPGLSLQTTSGSDRSASGTLAWRPMGSAPGTFLVAEAEGGLGVGEGRSYGQLRAAAGAEHKAGSLSARAMGFAYTGQFESPGVLRAGDLAAGDMDFYGAYPEAGGGQSSRVLGVGIVSRQQGEGGLRATGWAGGRRLSLDQNYSGYLRDPVHGDGTRQAELAADAGVKVETWRLFELLGAPSSLRGGASVHGVAVTASEAGLTPAGEAWQQRLDSDARHLDAGLWTEGRLQLGSLSLVPGLRLDRLQLALRDHRDADFQSIAQPEWAHSGATVLSPRARAAWELSEPLTLFGAYGRGFRSPGARGIEDGDLAPIMKSDTAEGGLALRPHRALTLQATGFGIVVSNELVFDHLAGRFLSAGRTQRLGVEAVADLRPEPWLHLQADATYTDGRFAVDRQPIPYAPRLLCAGGLFLEGAPLARGQLSGGLRVQALGPRPLPDGFASHPSVVGTLTSRLSFRDLELGLAVDNLFLRKWRDGEWLYPSWFDQDSARSELKVLHVTAGDPFALRFTLGVNL